MIRQMSMDDLQAVEALEQRCFRSSWNEEQLRYELEENAFSHALVLEEAGEIVGSMIYWTIFETCQLCRIAVSPDQRRKGYGRECVAAILDYAKQMECYERIVLRIHKNNTESEAFAKSMGFKRSGSLIQNQEYYKYIYEL